MPNLCGEIDFGHRSVVGVKVLRVGQGWGAHCTGRVVTENVCPCADLCFTPGA